MDTCLSLKRRMQGWRFVFVLGLLIGTGSGVAQADALRCNGDLAGIGDSKGQVFQKCGQPFFQDAFCKTPDQLQIIVPPSPPWPPQTINVPCIMVEEWYYNPGSGQFITIMRFEQGVMTAIRYGDRVR